jgi:aminocarboxymuconate-semialdehyde decarboxylase
MPIIDMHAHVTPERYKKGIRENGEWYGLDATPGEIGHGKFAISLEDRIAEMDELGCDMQLVTPTVGFYQYANDLETTKKIHRECNAEIAEMVSEHPDRFAGLAMCAMQDPSTAIEQMAYAVQEQGLRGVVLSDHVLEKNYDDPSFLPFFEAAEQLGALLFFHQGPGDTCVEHRTKNYKLSNAVGNLAERTLVYGTLVFGGILDRFPDLTMLLAHGGGYTPYGVVRMDKVSGALEPDSTGGVAPVFGGREGFHNERPPTEYLQRFYYDCCTYSGPVLRFLIDTVGIDRVVLGTDYPAPMTLLDAVNWVRGLPELTDDEKEKILVTNPTSVVGV